ncbi:hypothetical protein EBU71_14740, partial [bacterium]|nr:hypothetical protein [Candidatus Elulimicrobium humile]
AAENDENKKMISVMHPRMGYHDSRLVEPGPYALITKDGIWIPKIISDQYEYVNDLDVIDTNTKTSFVNYQNLQNTFYTKIGGEGYEVNPQIHLDKNDNVYMAGVYDSDEVSIYDFTNQNVPVGSLQLDGEQSLFITKYDSAGVNQWYTRVGGYYAKEEPSIFVNGNGDVFVVMQSYEGGEESINIYDVNNVQYPAKTLSEYSETNTVLVKYNSKGEFQWNIRMKAFTVENESFTSTACVTGDLEGNLFVSGYFDSETISIYDTGSDETPCKTFNRFLDGEYACYFICKFDYRGKFTWLNHLEGGFVPNNHIAPPDYIKYFRINLNTDSLGNLYLTSSFYSQVFIYNPDGDEPENIIFGGNDGTGLFTVKYNSMGIYQWNTGIFTEADTDEGPGFLTGAVEAGSCVDADGNLYVCFSNLYVYNYGIFDTRKSSAQPVYTYENESLKDSFVSVVKFNHRGVYQWNNFVKVNDNQYDFDITISPVITCDNQYIIGQNNPNIYIHFNGFIDDYRGGFNFYNAKSNLNIAYTLPSKDYWIDNKGQEMPPENLTNAVSISAGLEHSLALLDNGTVVAWGDNTYGQCNVPSNLVNVCKIAAGTYGSAAILENGDVVAWGFSMPSAPWMDQYLNSINPNNLKNVFQVGLGGETYVITSVSSFRLSINNDNTKGIVVTDPNMSTSSHFSENQIVEIAVNPSPGYLFSSFSIDISETNNPAIVLMDANKTITVNYINDPRDIDNDGLSNFDEIKIYNTDPSNADSNADGIIDGSAVSLGYSPFFNFLPLVNYLRTNPVT